MVKGNFPKKRKSVFYDEKNFREEFFRPHFRVPFVLYLSTINQKKANEEILHKVRKTLFLGSFWPKFGQNFFFKIGLRHILGVAILHHVQKIRKN